MTGREHEHVGPGTLLAGYRIDQLLGSGGMGCVYLAHAASSARQVALKILNADLSADPVFRRRFVRESQLASALNHPNIVPVYGHGETADGKLWMAMPYVAGTDADAELRAGRMPPTRAVRIVTEVASALDHAHGRSLLHGDVKPANVLLSREQDDRALLSDFGVARSLGDDDLTGRTGVALVTAAYAAPEVLRGSQPAARSDVYALGGSLFRLLTGRPPFFDAASKAETVRSHLHRSPPRATRFAPWLPPQVDDVLAMALAKDPADRYRSAGELARAATEAVVR